MKKTISLGSYFFTALVNRFTKKPQDFLFFGKEQYADKDSLLFCRVCEPVYLKACFWYP